MPVPESYTEETLAIYCQFMLGPLADELGWSIEDGDYQEIVNSALLLMGTSNIAEITTSADVEKLRLFARMETWRQVCDHTAGDYNFQTDGGRFDRAMVNEMAQERLRWAESDVLAHNPAYKVKPVKVTYKHDPYIHLEDDDRSKP